MKYLILLLLALSFPLKASSQLAMPIDPAGQNKDWWVWSYVDHDTTAGSARNYKCSNYCYDGWTGMIFVLKNMKLMDKGIPVLAAANGIVVSVRNGDTDRVKRVIGGGTHGNFVRIKHNPQLFTVYAFLKNNSIRVHDGQIVKKGDTLAMAGSSDNIFYYSGLYFKVEDSLNGKSQDPLGDECSTPVLPALLVPGPIYDSTFGYIDCGITNHLQISDDTLMERPPTLSEISVTEDDYVTTWLEAKNIFKGDIAGTLWIDPHGKIFHDGRNGSGASRDFHLAYYRRREPTYLLDTGVWNVNWYYNGDSVCHLTFHVVQQHSAVAKTNSIIQATIFPQPAKDHVTISGIKVKQVHLYDIEGIEHPIRFEQTSDGARMYWRDLPQGMYSLGVKDERGVSHHAKLMISP